MEEAHETRDSTEEVSEAETDIVETQDGTEDEDGDQGNESGSENAEEDDGSESGSELEEEDNPPSNESDSDNTERDKCCICLHKLKDQEIGVPTVCEHRFCCECITEWHKNSQTCPIDRQTFSSISVLRDDGIFLRIEELRAPEDSYLELPPLPDDITQCEVCGLGDREDRLLLCDECNFGYHLECLNPPLQTVPLDDWFCPSCTEDQDAHPRRRRTPALRAPPEIILPPAEPGSIERSLLTRRIRQRRQKSRRKTVKRKTTKRKRKTTTKGKSRAKSRTTKGKASTRRRKGRKVRRKGKRKARVAVQEKPTTARERLASQLGIVPPKPGQIYLGLPTCKSASQPSTSAAAMGAVNHNRFRAGIPTLRLYSHYEDLADCLENESDDDENLLGEGSVGLIRPARHRNARLPSKPGLEGPIQPTSQASGVDILSQIMSSQQTLLMDRNIRIGHDGVLIPSIDATIRNEPNHGSDGKDTSVVSKPTSCTKGGGWALPQSPNGKIRQAPLNNSQPSSNSTQHSHYNNDNSTYLGRQGESYSRTESEPVSSVVSNSHGNENNQDNTDTVSLGSSDQCGQSPKKSNLSKTKNEDKTKQNKDDDEEFNIYSDIQENNVADVIDPVATLPVQAELCSGEIQNESDNEMIIDEAANSRRTSSENRPSNQEPASDYVAFPPMTDSDDSPSPGMPEADSPESIPLPDSTPPPSVPMPEAPEEDEVDEIQGGSVLYSPSDDEESGRQVYDPSQPLTSSDEEEHNDRQQPAKPAPKEAVNKSPQPSGARTMNLPKVDVASIPVPADEQRRPTIQFSIPTRHKLIPISSLIRRQRGVIRKESTGIPSNQLDPSKLFGESSQKDTADGSLVGAERPSLVAEIFGSDDEEEDNETAVDESTAQEISASDATETTTTVNEPLIERSENMQSNKWKRVDETPVPAPVPAGQNTVSSDVLKPVTSEEANEPEPEAEKSEENKLKQAKNGDANRKPMSSLELVSDGSDDDITIISATRKEDKDPDIIFLSSEKSSSNSKDSSGKERTRDKSKDSDKRSRKEKEERHSRSQKRKRSSSLSNYEEGEIPSLGKKKKKVKKSKKVKKRKRSKDSSSSPRPNISERQPEINQNFNSSSDGDEGRKVSWRKPSKSTKERNYRDGKPKNEDKYFREKDKVETAHERKEVREKSPHHRSRERRGSKNEVKKSHRRSASREKVSPIRWSRSPSPSRNRAKGHRDKRSRSLSSRESFSPRRSNHSRGRHLGHPLSIRNEKSNSRSPRVRSRSPNNDRHRHRRRSRSNHRRGGRAGSSSASRSRSRSKTRRRHDKLDSSERAKKGSSKKDKVVKESADDVRPEEETRDKEKKKKRKRREKSISPAKAVFADGDSIVISLNFQKPKEMPKESTEERTEAVSHEEEKSTDKKKKRSSGRDSSSGKSKPLKKTVLIDLETSPIQEEKIGESPTLVVLSDDEDELNQSKSSRKSKDSYQNDKDHEGVTTSGTGDESSSPNFQNENGVQADSTQVQQTETTKSTDFLFGNEDSSSSPTAARDDSVVTSTRDSIEGAPQTEEDNESRSNSPKPPEPPSIRNDSPRTKTPPTSASPLGKQAEGLRVDALRSTPTSTASMMPTGNTNPALPSGPSSASQSLVRPLGIGNIPGLFPSSGLVSGIPVPPSPVVIPTPPQPQLRFPTNAMNPSINILASVASALYGPLMAARQAQPILSKPVTATNNISQRATSQSSTLLSSQNSNSHGRRTGDGGDSPFSPNSSDGDDLFEPPLEKRTSQNPKDSQSNPSGNSIGHKSEKTDRPAVPNPPIIGNTASAVKSKSSLFDSLFGSPSKKTPTGATQSSAVHSKAHVKIKSKPHESSKSRGAPKPDAPKQLSEGELRQTEDVPTSAVELRVKEKYLKKLNRQERVVEEVKLALKPHYGKKSINKDDYKEILRRAVPKICHTKSGEINPFKIKELVEAYVKKFRHSKGK